MCLVGSGQEIAFKIQAMPFNDAIKTADTVCSIDPFSVDMTQNTLSRPDETTVSPTPPPAKTLAER